MRGHVAVKSAYCVACRRCALACAVEHSASKNLADAVNEKDAQLPCVEIREHRGLNVPIECRHCENAQCVTVCPTGAMHRLGQNGPVILSRDRCVGCRSCMAACHFGVPRMSRDGKSAFKCDQCLERLDRGEQPACVGACHTGSLTFVREDGLTAGKNLVERFAARTGVDRDGN